MDVEQVDGLVVAMIGEAVLAGAYLDAMRQDPETSGFERLRRKHSERVRQLAAEITEAMR